MKDRQVFEGAAGGGTIGGGGGGWWGSGMVAWGYDSVAGYWQRLDGGLWQKWRGILKS